MSSLDCPKQATCPGCPLGAEQYAAGLARKGEALGRTLAGFPSLTPTVASPRAASPTLSYRLRAKLVIDERALGLYARGSHRVVDVSGCRVLSPALAASTEAVRRALPLPVYAADLRETSEGVLVTLLTDRASTSGELEAAARALVAQGAALSVAVSVRPAGNERLLAGEPRVVAGPTTAQHRLSPEAPYAYAAHGGFVQAHAGQASYVREQIALGAEARLGQVRGARLLELFAGNGSLALALAQAGADVCAVESFAPAIELCERAAREQRLTLRAVRDDAARFVTAVAEQGERYDAIIVNPPRRGLTRELRVALAKLEPRAIAYVSCNPETLARDAWHLQQLGLELKSAEPLDMIPWSDAVEVLAWLEPAPAPAPRVLHEDERVRAVDAVPHELLPGASGVHLREKAGTLGAERELTVLARGTLRKQGTITRRTPAGVTPGVRYQKQRQLGRHSLLRVWTRDADELGTLRDFASIGHPVLGDSRHGDARSNQYLEHRHGLDRAFVHVSAVKWRGAEGHDFELRAELAPDLGQVLQSLAAAEPDPESD